MNTIETREIDDKSYPIESDCMWDKEYFVWRPTVWKCGCCHVQVKPTDTQCWHCRSKLIPIPEPVYNKY